MIWLFERGSEVLHIETRIDNASGEYVLVSISADGPPQVERFRDRDAYEARVLELENRLAADQWVQVGGPTILPDGWRGPIPN